jgi:predicted DNA-binding transcriptional regulator AlpA
MIAAQRTLTEDEMRTLPPVVDVPTAAIMLGIGRSAAYELIRCNEWPTPILRLGKLIRIPTAPILDLLNISR